MHIASVCFNAFGGGAVQQRALREAEALCKMGHTVTLFTDQHPTPGFHPFDTRLVPTWRIPGPLHGVIMQCSFSLFLRTALVHCHAANPFDVLVVHGSSHGLAAAAFERITQVPWIFVMTACIFDKLAPSANPYNKPLTLFYRHTNRFSCQRATRVVAVSDDMRRWAEYCGCPQSRVVVIPNSVPAYFEVPYEGGPPEASGPYILYVGRLSPEKGPDILLQAFAHVTEKNNDIDLHLIGDGNIQSFAEKARSLGVNWRVTFHGPLPQSVLPGWYKGAMMVIIPSRSDAQPVVLLEALASGCPVVASRVGGIPEIVQDGESGLLVEPDSPPELAEAIVRLFEDPHLRERLKRGALDTAHKYSFRDPFEKTHALFHELAQMSAASLSEGSIRSERKVSGN